MDDDNDDHNDDEIKDENQVRAGACLADRSRTGLVISGPHSSSSLSSIFLYLSMPQGPNQMYILRSVKLTISPNCSV